MVVVASFIRCLCVLLTALFEFQLPVLRVVLALPLSTMAGCVFARKLCLGLRCVVCST